MCIRDRARAVGNLLDNAIAATDVEGQILIELPKPSVADDWRGMIVITDNGAGMSPDELAHAEGNLRTSSDQGSASTGLGLRLARQLVEAHDGTLEIASEKGVGTVVEIRLP